MVNYNLRMARSYWRWIVLAAITGSPAPAEEPAVIDVVRNGSPAQLQDLIARKEGLHARGAQNQTALHEAAATCNLEAARALVQAGLDRSALDNAGRAASQVALNCRGGESMKELVRLLYVPRPRPTAAASGMERWTLQGAAARGDANVVEMLLKLGTDANGTDEKGDRAIEVAYRKGNARIVEILLKRGADVKLTSSSGTSVLHEAALGGDARVVELLLEHGAIVDVADQEKAATALHYAASFGRLEAARVLLRHGADVRRKDRNGRDALTLATDNGHADVAQMLRTSSGK